MRAIGPLSVELAKGLDLFKGIVPILRTGAVRPTWPNRLVAMGVAAVRWGLTPAAALAVSGRRFPTRVALIDEAGPLTYGDLDADITALARSLAELGVGERSIVAVMCRNHRGFLQALGAAGRLGCDHVLFNTGLSQDQVSEVLAEQRIDVLIADGEFAAVIPPRSPGLLVVQAWQDSPEDFLDRDVSTIADLIANPPNVRLPIRPRAAHPIMLTSGTTGTPKGAKRSVPKDWTPAAALFSRIPLRAGTTNLISAPIFHSWGFGALLISIGLGGTAILQRKFEPAAALAAIARYRVDSVFVVPVMLQRILELPDDIVATDTRSVRIIIACGSAIPPPVVKGTLAAFGPVLYNLYGSTEVAWATIADPAELTAHPTTAGRAPIGTRVVIIDAAGRPLRAGQVGQVFVGNGMLFDGYIRREESKQIIDGLMATGDMGHLSADGLLFLDGRVDDMIVSGGENVYPRATEDVVARVAGVREVAVVGAPDEKFGQRLVAYVVREGDDVGSQLDAESLLTVIKPRLARFGVPRDIVFIDELPRNATGKVVPRLLTTDR